MHSCWCILNIEYPTQFFSFKLVCLFENFCFFSFFPFGPILYWPLGPIHSLPALPPLLVQQSPPAQQTFSAFSFSPLCAALFCSTQQPPPALSLSLLFFVRQYIGWKPTTLRKLRKLYSGPHDDDPRERSWEERGVICKKKKPRWPTVPI